MRRSLLIGGAFFFIKPSQPPCRGFVWFLHVHGQRRLPERVPDFTFALGVAFLPVRSHRKGQTVKDGLFHGGGIEVKIKAKSKGG